MRDEAIRREYGSLEPSQEMTVRWLTVLEPQLPKADIKDLKLNFFDGVKKDRILAEQLPQFAPEYSQVSYENTKRLERVIGTTHIGKDSPLTVADR